MSRPDSRCWNSIFLPTKPLATVEQSGGKKDLGTRARCKFPFSKNRDACAKNPLKHVFAILKPMLCQARFCACSAHQFAIRPCPIDPSAAGLCINFYALTYNLFWGRNDRSHRSVRPNLQAADIGVFTRIQRWNLEGIKREMTGKTGRPDKFLL